MKWIAYAVILGLLFLVPVERLDVAKLVPVQTVAMYTEPGTVVLETDTHNVGKGSSVSKALQNLEDTTAGVIYLDTAEFLLVSTDAQSYVDALREYLNPSVRVSMWDGKGAVDTAAKYLSTMENLPKLKHWKQGL